MNVVSVLAESSFQLMMSYDSIITAKQLNVSPIVVWKALTKIYSHSEIRDKQCAANVTFCAEITADMLLLITSFYCTTILCCFPLDMCFSC